MDIGEIVLLGFVGLILYVGYAAIRNVLRAQRLVSRRPAEFKALGDRLGLRYVEFDPEKGEPAIEKTLFHDDVGSPYGKLVGDVEGLPVEVFESSYRRGGRTGHDRLRLAFLVGPGSGKWPRFAVQPEGYASDPADVDESLEGCVQVELEHEEFDNEYTLAQFPDEDVTPRFKARLIDRLLALKKEDEGWAVESYGDRALVWRVEESVPIDQVEARLRSALRVWRIYDEALAR